MKVIIFGATGTTGREVVNRALEVGHRVTAFVRNPDKVEQADPNLTLFQGDVLNPAEVAKAIEGHEAVLSSLGAGLNGRVRSEGTQNIIQGMKQTGLSRLISQSTLGAGDSRGNLNFYWKYLMFGLLLRKAYADHGRQESYIKQSGLDWTIVRPGALTDGPRTGQYRHGFAGTDKSTALKVSAADVADFMVNHLTDDAYLYATPGLSY